MSALKAIAAQISLRTTVHDDWEFSSGSERGLGLAVLFAGSSGTGKTTAAEVLARELRLDLYRVDLSQVVSKYIGETEKNLRRVFDAADEGGVVLLFDEADALFGKRTEVTSSNDRHANVEVGYLLQRIEAFRGLAILTTNMKTSIDAAFQRRLRFIVTFPFPDATIRAQIWARMFPAKMPAEVLDYDRLAQLALSGGQIRSVALNAAFLAAAAGQPLSMSDIKAAARMEYGKQDKTLSEAELKGWPE
jgi:SpoVK/Ycf46/Vps4 family AAA+-type ATPase